MLILPALSQSLSEFLDRYGPDAPHEVGDTRYLFTPGIVLCYVSLIGLMSVSSIIARIHARHQSGTRRMVRECWQLEAR